MEEDDHAESREAGWNFEHRSLGDRLGCRATTGIRVDEGTAVEESCRRGVRNHQVTRGQMAALLAEALGLHWPN